MNSILAFVRAEPIIITQALAAVLTLGAAFGLRFTPEQTEAIIGVGVVVAAVVGRRLVTPNPAVATQVQAALMTPVPVTPT